jgi:ABC-type nitrate/sulfonate/bicarbonate transport system substrate-binding protein
MDSFFKKIFLTLLFVVFAVAQVHSGQYRIATVAWIGWSPLHVASQKGFWDELVPYSYVSIIKNKKIMLPFPTDFL